MGTGVGGTQSCCIAHLQIAMAAFIYRVCFMVPVLKALASRAAR